MGLPLSFVAWHLLLLRLHVDLAADLGEFGGDPYSPNALAPATLDGGR
jgi:hypothetical protein